MQVSQAVAIWLEYHRSKSKENALRAYRSVLDIFCAEFGERKLTPRDPKSGRSQEVIFIPQKVAERLKD